MTIHIMEYVTVNTDGNLSGHLESSRVWTV